MASLHSSNGEKSPLFESIQDLAYDIGNRLLEGINIRQIFLQRELKTYYWINEPQKTIIIDQDIVTILTNIRHKNVFVSE